MPYCSHRSDIDIVPLRTYLSKSRTNRTRSSITVASVHGIEVPPDADDLWCLLPMSLQFCVTYLPKADRLAPHARVRTPALHRAADAFTDDRCRPTKATRVRSRLDRDSCRT